MSSFWNFFSDKKETEDGSTEGEEQSKEDARECLKAWREQLIERELIEHEIESLKPPKLKGRVSA